jgi:hypothetical protein
MTSIRYEETNRTVYRNEKQQYHRVDGPAIVNNTGAYAGDKYWYQNGLLHREDGPAEERFSEKREDWWILGKRHRIGGPAHTSPYEKSWWRNGIIHRLNAPAQFIYNDDGSCVVRYYIFGNLFSVTKQNAI